MCGPSHHEYYLVCIELIRVGKFHLDLVDVDLIAAGRSRVHKYYQVGQSI